MEVKVKVLSLTQPWAQLVVIGAKKFETRSWATSYRGELYIHASKGFPKDCKELLFISPFNAALGFKSWSALPLGAIIGKVNLIGCIATQKIAHAVLPIEKEFGDFSPGRFAWIVEKPVIFDKPIPAKGSLGIWTWEKP